MQYLNLLNISILEYSLIGALSLVFLFQIYYYARYMAAPARAIRRAKKRPVAESAEKPGVTIIVSAHNEAYNLERYLQSLLTQDYPEYEVIVVDDGSEDKTREIIDSYLVKDKRLRSTFVPVDARVRSTKKLALTLAVKASKYDYLLLTDADCRPESNHWISAMMAGFLTNNAEIVLGYGAYFYEKGEINRLVRYDTLFNGLHYLGSALCGHPYMGVGRNLAYRKSTFEDNGGFARYMTVRAGDDDLFVNHVATAHNTVVVVGPDSITWSRSKTTLKDWLQQKRRHIGVSPLYRAATKFRLAVEPVTRGIFYALIIAIIVLAILGYVTSPLIWAATALLCLVRWLVQTLIINISARRLGEKCFGLIVVWYDMVLPLISLYMLTTRSLTKTNRW